MEIHYQNISRLFDEICSVLFSRCSFYNYPYTFGYLASFSLLEIAKERKSTFHLKYKRVLRETGKNSVEELMKNILK